MKASCRDCRNVRHNFAVAGLVFGSARLSIDLSNLSLATLRRVTVASSNTAGRGGPVMCGNRFSNDQSALICLHRLVSLVSAVLRALYVAGVYGWALCSVPCMPAGGIRRAFVRSRSFIGILSDVAPPGCRRNTSVSVSLIARIWFMLRRLMEWTISSMDVDGVLDPRVMIGMKAVAFVRSGRGVVGVAGESGVLGAGGADGENGS